jgi:two-component system LytT family response regulator
LKYLFKIESISEGENGLKIMIKSEQTMKSISYSDIVVIKGAGRNSEIIRADEEKFRIQKSLKSWETTLPGKTFLRVHHSVIINTDYLETVERGEEDKYFVHLRGYAEPVPVGIRHLKKIKHLTN